MFTFADQVGVAVARQRQPHVKANPVLNSQPLHLQLSVLAVGELNGGPNTKNFCGVHAKRRGQLCSLSSRLRKTRIGIRFPLRKIMICPT